jgi:hypothetical protein
MRHSKSPKTLFWNSSLAKILWTLVVQVWHGYPSGCNDGERGEKKGCTGKPVKHSNPFKINGCCRELAMGLKWITVLAMEKKEELGSDDHQMIFIGSLKNNLMGRVIECGYRGCGCATRLDCSCTGGTGSGMRQCPATSEFRGYEKPRLVHTSCSERVPPLEAIDRSRC